MYASRDARGPNCDGTYTIFERDRDTDCGPDSLSARPAVFRISAGIAGVSGRDHDPRGNGTFEEVYDHHHHGVFGGRLDYGGIGGWNGKTLRVLS